MEPIACRIGKPLFWMLLTGAVTLALGGFVEGWRVLPGFWLAFLTLALVTPLLGYALARARADARRRAMAHLICPTCGYDLRATPERCPECGTVVAPAAAPPAV